MRGENSKLYKGFVSGLPINLIDITDPYFSPTFVQIKRKKILNILTKIGLHFFSVWLVLKLSTNQGTIWQENQTAFLEYL